MRTLLMLIAIIIFTTDLIGMAKQVKKTIRIFTIQSYSINQFCELDQLQGFKYELSKFSDKYEFIIHTFYMNSLNLYKTDTERRQISTVILARIKAFHPDVVMIFDDTAFKYVAPYIPASIPIVFSGMNNHFEDYVQHHTSLAHRKVAGVKGSIKFTSSFEEFLKKNVDTIYILYDNTPTSYYMEENFLEQFAELEKQYPTKFLNLQIKVIHIVTVNSLKNLLETQCRSPDRKLYIVTLQSLYDPAAGVQFMKPQIYKVFQQYNDCCQGGFELSPDVCAIKYLTMVYGPDPYEMGVRCADLMIKVLEQHQYEIQEMPMRFFISKHQLERICKYTDFIDENIDEFTGIYP